MNKNLPQLAVRKRITVKYGLGFGAVAARICNTQRKAYYTLLNLESLLNLGIVELTENMDYVRVDGSATRLKDIGDIDPMSNWCQQAAAKLRPQVE